jgi:hypothetical protein
MALPITRWARQAIRREHDGDFAPVADTRVLRDVETLKALHRQTWRERQRAIRDTGLPVAAEGSYAAIARNPIPQTYTTTSLSGSANLWPTTSFTQIDAGQLVPQAYKLVVRAKITTVASPANIGFDPRIGTTAWTTGGTAISGTTLGASTNVALTASITNAFYWITGDVLLRSPGTTGSVVGMFHYMSTQATASGLAGPAVVGAGHNLLFGGTTASIDLTATQGVQLGAVHTVTTITHNVEQALLLDWN